MTNVRNFIMFITLLTSSLLATSITLAADSKATNKQKPLQISRITPTGEDVVGEEQMVFTFNQPVIPLGKMERAASDIPITIAPAVNCQWRWLDPATLACQLGDSNALAPATTYEIEVRPGIMTEANKTLLKPVNHQFTTQRPTLSWSSFGTWQTPGWPVIQVGFNQSVTKTSVAKHVYLQIENGKRVPLKVTPVPVNEKEDAEENTAAEETSQTQPASTVSATTTAEEAENWLIAPVRELPLGTNVSLMIEPGLQSTAGPVLGVEEREESAFATFPEFQFLGIECTSLKNEEIKLAPGEGWTQRCDPVAGAFVVFSSPISAATLKQHIVVTPDLAGGRKDYDPWEGANVITEVTGSHTKEDTYRIWLPEILKAYATYQLKSKDLAELTDGFARPLAEDIDFEFATDHRAPSYVFEHEFSVLETGVDSEVPLYVTNLNKLTLNYNELTEQGWGKTEKKVFTLPKVPDVAIKTPLGIRDLLPTSSGVVQGYFVTSPDVNNENAKTANWFFSEVTPFHVQVKLGHHNTLVWVTELATGLPVSGATISVDQHTYRLKDTAAPKTLATAITDEQGVAMLPGTQKLDPALKISNSYGENESHLFVRCQKGEEMAWLPLDYRFAVQSNEIMGDDFSMYPYQRPQYGHIHTWGTTAQGVYKVGDTIQYKFLVRNQDNQAFTPPPKDGYTLQIIDPKDETVHEVKALTLSEFGAYAGEFTLPKTAAVGWYKFKLTAKFTEDTWEPMSVLVSDFTPSPFRVQTMLNGELFKLGDSVKVDTSALLHAGGPYTDAPTKVTARLAQEYFAPTHPQAKGFTFDVYVDKVDEETIYATDTKVNNQGQVATTFKLPEKSKVLYGKLTVESAVRDDRGKEVANRATARYVGRDRFIGLKATSWFITAGQAAKILMIVVDEKGNPVTGSPVKAKIERQDLKAARVKGAGNAYLTQYQEEWVSEATCDATSTTEAVPCTFTPTKAGDYKITATVDDTKSRSQTTELRQWSVGKGEVVWALPTGNGLELKAEQEGYKVGETARYLVKNPFPGTLALITVERFGVLKSWVKQLENSVEVIEIPVEPDYLPGFFVSVMVTSPRVEKPLNQDQVDLGKPAFRMGYAKTMVLDPYKELEVVVQSDKPQYKPGETVTLNLQAKARQAEVNAQPLELAVTVLDEAVFDLIGAGRNYFDPYRGFYTLDDLDLYNYSLLMRLVGRQKFEKKGANAGGDGGGMANLDMRSVFKYVSYWDPALKTDAEGKAQIQFPVPDNLTGWRVLAMAVNPNDRMGLGEGTFKVNQPLELRPVLPNQVTTGDSFQAGFNIMNRTEQPQTVNVTLMAKGAVEVPATDKLTQTLTAEPFKRYNVWLPLTTKGAGTIDLTVTATMGSEQDGLQKTLTVQPRRALDTAATYGTSTEETATESIEFPKEIQTGVGGLTVQTSPTLIGDLEGAFAYMRDYPYSCWEQKLSKGVVASQYNNLLDYLADDLTWTESKQLPTETLALAADYQAPNGGMSLWLAKDDYVSPYLSAYTALAFNWLRDSGYAIPEAVENKLHEYLLTLLRRDVMPSVYTKNMSSTVRAVALAALAKHQKIARADLNRYQAHLKNMDLFGKTLFLQAALPIAGTDKLRTEVVKQILSNVVDQTAGKIAFKESLDDSYKFIFSSSLRTQCAILSALTQYEEVAHNELVSDIPLKLARNLTAARKAGGSWGNTQENLFCLNAMTDFMRVYEKDKPAVKVSAFLDSEKLGETQFDDVKNPPVTFTHALADTDPGRHAEVKVEREGQGRVYYTVRMSYAPKDEVATAVNAGFEVNREYAVERDGKWSLLKTPMALKTGELVRVDLYISLPAPRYFVVVDDPIPGGLEPVNRDLATASEMALQKAEAATYPEGSVWFKHQEDWRNYGDSFDNFYHQELRHHAARFYADYLAAGDYHLSYVAQVIASGEFIVMPTLVEQMYEPEVYGKAAPAQLKITRVED